MCDNSSPKIVSNIITNNSADYTGGVDCSINSSAIILNNVISYNTATENIGGLCLYDNSNAHVEGNIISNNTAISAGGITVQASFPTFVNNIICNNTAGEYVGGLAVILGSIITIENCHIYGNAAGFSRGGLGVYGSTAEVKDCTINENHAGTYGGGVGIYENSDVNLSYTSIFGNSASSDGGGIEISMSTPTITNCTIYGNEAPNFGSQIDCWSGGLEAVNSFIGGNSTNGSVHFNTSAVAFNYCDFFNHNGPDFSGSIPPGLGDIVGENANGDPCDIFWNIFLDPLFVDPANDDFHLTEFSPCIDAGDPTSPPDPNGSIVDIGRYYYYDPPGTDDNTIVQTKDYLHQNYPNPFNPETTINYLLPENSRIELTVYNLKGQKVKTLVNETLESGNYTVIWNGTDSNGKSVSSGMYFYKLKTDNHEEAKKMILLR